MTYQDPQDLAAQAQKIASDVLETNEHRWGNGVRVNSLCTAIELLAAAIGSIAAEREAPTS